MTRRSGRSRSFGIVGTVALTLVLASVPVLGVSAVDNGLADDPGVEHGADIVGDGWIRFTWSGQNVNGAPFEFTAELPTTLRVTDAFCYGDQFAVDDQGVPLGETSEPGSTACGGPTDPDAAYEDPDMSSGCFLLLPGAHSIGIEVLQSPIGAGGGYLRADTVLDYLGTECITIPPLPGS